MPREYESVKEELVSRGLKKKVLHLREKEVKVLGLGLTSEQALAVESVCGKSGLSTLGLTSSEKRLCPGLRQADYKWL